MDDEPPDIRARLRQVTADQQDFARLIAARLGVDSAGLAAMFYLGMLGSATPTEVARSLKISTAATTLVLNRLEAAGHVSRRPHESDRRKVVVEPSASSLATAFELVRPIIDGVEQLTAAMTPAERTAVATFLDNLIGLYAQHPPHQTTSRPNDLGDGALFTT